MPVIQLMGLPGSGKSTLAQRLLGHLGWRHSFRIGTYHKRFPETPEGEAGAWKAMLDEMAQCGGDRFIFETTGLNERWNEVIKRCSCGPVLTFKLECKLPRLTCRIAAKTAEDQAHGDWFPHHRFRNKTEFVQANYEEFSRRRADVILDTTHASSEAIFDLVARFLSSRPGFL